MFCRSTSAFSCLFLPSNVCMYVYVTHGSACWGYSNWINAANIAVWSLPFAVPDILQFERSPCTLLWLMCNPIERGRIDALAKTFARYFVWYLLRWFCTSKYVHVDPPRCFIWLLHWLVLILSVIILRKEH